MTLQRLISLAGAAIVALALASAIALVGITTATHRATQQLATTLESVRAAERLQADLARSSHATTMLALTDDARYLAERQSAEAALQRSVEFARARVGDAREGRSLDAITAALDSYLGQRAMHEAHGGPALAHYRTLSPAFDTAEQSIHGFVIENDRQAAAAEQRVAAWAHRVDELALGLVALFVAVPLALLLAIRKHVTRPLVGISATVRQLVHGERAARAQLGGAEEVRDIAAAINEAADSLDRQRGMQLQFLAGVAHDLRNPLAALKLAASPRRDDSPPRTVEDFEKLRALVSRQVDRLDRMVGDLLDATRVEAGELRLRTEACDARDLLRATVALFESSSPSHELVCSVPDERLEVQCDGARIEQVLNNLVSNAIKYSPRGGRVELGARRDGDDVVITVRDEGIGIAASDVPHIFEPFRRTAATRDAIPGVGLGLSVTRRIVTAHGGSLSVESEPGRGTTFTVRLRATTATGLARAPGAVVIPLREASSG